MNDIVDTNNLSNLLSTRNDNQILRVTDLDGEIRINDALISTPNLYTNNGVLHSIDNVLIPEGTFDIVESVLTDKRFSILAEVIEEINDSNLNDSLVQSNRTLIAPSDEAFTNLFDALGVSKQQFLQRNDLESIIRHHLIEIEFSAADAVDLASQTSNTISSSIGESLTFQVEDTTLFVDRSQVTETNIRTNNGFIHIIDKVLIPPGTFNLMEAVQSDGRFSILATAIEQANLKETVATISEATLFAPSNEAFDEFFATNEEVSNIEDLLALDNLEDILKYHIATSLLSETSLNNASGSTIDSLLANQAVGIATQAQDLFVNNAFVFEQDLDTSNASLHAIDRVLTPITNSHLSDQELTTWGLITDLAFNPEPEFSILRQALQDQGLEATLRGQGPFTLFAPTNEAFEKIGDLETILSLTLLKDILQQHIILGSELNSVSLYANIGKPIDTLDTSISVSVGALRTLEINGNTITVKDIQTSDGVIHVIDTVITN